MGSRHQRVGIFRGENAAFDAASLLDGTPMRHQHLMRQAATTMMIGFRDLRQSSLRGRSATPGHSRSRARVQMPRARCRPVPHSTGAPVTPRCSAALPRTRAPAGTATGLSFVSAPTFIDQSLGRSVRRSTLSPRHSRFPCWSNSTPDRTPTDRHKPAPPGRGNSRRKCLGTGIARTAP